MPPSDAAAPATTGAVGADTVEAVVRAQLSKALGGKRGMLEGAVPTLAFTLIYLTTKDVALALGVSIAGAVVLLVLRLVHRSTVQFVANSLFGIGIGGLFVYLSARGGGDASHKALAYFLPGLIWNVAYGSFLVLSIAVRWPLVGFMVGSVAGDPTAWHHDEQVVRLCRNLTWVLALPFLLRIPVQVPIYLAGKQAGDADPFVTALAISKIAMGWPLFLAALAGMVWLLARDRTPIDRDGNDPNLG